jgi:type IV conjugative transfer system pilin TraA
VLNYFKKYIGMHYQFVLLCIGIICMSTDVLATDLLAGTTDNLVETLNKSGKTYIYIAEFILSIVAYIKTKNILFLAGIVVVAVFFNVMLSVAGIG